MTRYWVVSDYLHRMTAWVAIALAKATNEVSTDPIDFRGWRFRFVFNNEMERVRISNPLEVSLRKKHVILNFTASYNGDSTVEEIVKIWLKNLFDLAEDAPDNPVFTLFGDDDSIVDTLHVLFTHTPEFQTQGINSIEFTVPFCCETDDLAASAFLDATMSDADDLAQSAL